MHKLIALLSITIILSACSNEKMEKKGFQIQEIVEDEKGNKILGLKLDSLSFETRPRNVLITAHQNHRLTPIFKVNIHKKTKQPFTGSNAFHRDWNTSYDAENNWHHNFMPGFSALYGYKMVNVSHYDTETFTQNSFFDSPVLIRTVYYPAFSKDTLNGEPIRRSYYMVSAYNEDTNKDGFINAKDLRRFYHFDLYGQVQGKLIPENYSVMNSEYDRVNDFMYVFAKEDENKNGQMEYEEPTTIFWIDLKDPNQVGKQFDPS